MIITHGKSSQETKILLAKNKFVYYLQYQKELIIFKQIFFIFPVFFLTSIAFQPAVFAGITEKTVEEYRTKAYEAQAKGNYQEALSFCVKAASLGPENAPLLNDVGVIYEKIGIPRSAEENYLRALTVDNNYLPAYANLAYLYAKENNIPKAIEYFQKRIELGDPNDPWTKKAKEEFLALDGDFSGIQKWLMQQEANELTEEMVKKSEESFYQAVAQSTKHYDEGRRLATFFKYDQALDEYNKALSFTPNNPKVERARQEVSVAQSMKHYREGQRLVALQKYSQAMDEYDKALSFTPHSPKVEKAQQEARLKSTKEKIQQHYDSAMKMLDLGDNVSAKVEFREILTLIPNESDTR